MSISKTARLGMVTLDWGDTSVTVPIWVAMRIRFRDLEVQVKDAHSHTLSDGELLVAYDEGDQPRCPPMGMDEILAALLHRHKFQPPRPPRPNEIGPSIEELVLAQAAPGASASWRLLDPQPLPPRALDLVPVRVRDALLDVVGLALAEAALGEVPTQRIEGAIGALQAEVDECGTPWRKPPRPKGGRRGPFPPLVAVLGVVAALPTGRVQADLAAAAAKMAAQLG